MILGAVTDRPKIGKYEVAEEIGKGSFGVVYRGRDPFLKREVAIKVCTVEDEEFRKRFFREAEIAGKLQHRNIVTVFAFGLEGEAPYLVQEYLSGRDLRHVIGDREELAVADKVDALRQVAAGLGHAHAEGVIHRDVKPANVRLLEDGTVKIMDFGIAKLAGAETQLTQAGVTMGTATYLSPEQVRGGGIDPRTDIFSLGVLAYELLTYRRPFHGNTLSALIYQILYKPPLSIRRAWSDCPQDLTEIVERCLQKDPEHRYRDCAELTGDLDEVWRTLTGTDRGAAERDAAEVRGPPEVRAAEVRAPEVRVPVSAAPAVRRPGADTAPATAERDSSEDATQPVAVVDAPAAEASPAVPSAAATKALSALSPAEPAAPALTDKAREIGELVAQGDLEAARRQLEATIELHQEKIAKPPPAATVEKAPRERSGAGAAIAAALARLKKWRRRWPQTGLPAFARWALPVSAVALAAVVVWWAAIRTPEAPMAQAPPPPASPAEPPPPPPMGAVAVDALPWAKITEISDVEGLVQDLPQRLHTPVLLRLAPGRYRVGLENPEHPELRYCDVEVAVDELATCSTRFAKAVALDYFKETGWWK